MTEIGNVLSAQVLTSIGIGVALLGLLIIAVIVIRSARSQSVMNGRDARFLDSAARITDERGSSSHTPSTAV